MDETKVIPWQWRELQRCVDNYNYRVVVPGGQVLEAVRWGNDGLEFGYNVDGEIRWEPPCHRVRVFQHQQILEIPENCS